jgi:uncharacterized membrane protein
MAAAMSPTSATWRDRLVEISADRPRLAWALWMTIAVGITYLHLFMRTTHIGEAELWLDESSTYGIAARSFGTVLTLPTEFHSQPPLYYLLLHFIIKINSSRWFIRGFSWFSCFLFIQFCLFYFDELTLMARVFLCSLFVLSDVCWYLSSALRPYGLAAFFTLVSSVMLTRMVREPTRRRAVVYCVWTLLMLYTMAFDVGVFLGHGAFVVLVWLAELRHGARAAFARYRVTVVAMAACAVGYLPYFLMAAHYHYGDNPKQSFARVLTTAAYTGPLQEHLGFGEPWMTLFYACMAVALVGALLQRDKTIFAWPLILVLQMAFVWVFIVGRSAIGIQGRYLVPGYVAAIALAAFGFQQVVAKTKLAAWLCLPLVIAWVALPRWQAFHTYVHAPPVIGTWSKLHSEMKQHRGKKVIFFYIGYAGQDFEYEVRHDHSVVVATMRGRWLASGGDNHLDPEYVTATIDKTQEETSCYYYWVQGSGGPFTTTFLPAMQRLGYVEAPAIGEVRRFCRPE